MRALIALSFLAGCGGATAKSDLSGPSDLAVDKAANCASTFGTALTNGFGRFDGTLRAVVPPTNTVCAQPNGTHLVLQLDDTTGATYRMVVDVVSNQGPPDVHYFTTDAPLAGGPYAASWHLGVQLDYAATLGVHAASFVATPEADLVQTISDQLTLGQPLSVFATSMDRPDSAHLVHKEGANIDGAIVVDPTGAPRYLLMAFDEDVF